MSVSYLHAAGRICLGLVCALWIACSESGDGVDRHAPAATPGPGATANGGAEIKPFGTTTSGAAPTAVVRPEPVTFSAQLDPFIPLVASDDDAEPAHEPHYRRREPQTALEAIDLSQLKLTSVFWGSAGPKALVEEGNGKGHIVAAGAHLGLNGGRVVEIRKDRLVILEQTEYADGRVQDHRRELHLQYESQEEIREPSAN